MPNRQLLKNKGVKKLQERIKPWDWKTRYGRARVVTTDKHMDRVRKMLDRDRLLVDTETNGLARDRDLRLLQIGWQHTAGTEVWLLDPISKYGRQAIEHIMRKPITLVCHNAPFDLLTLGLWWFGTGFGKGADKMYLEIYEWMTNKARTEQVCDTMVADQIARSDPRVRALSAVAAQCGVPNLYADKWNDNADKLGYTSDNKYAAVSVNNKHWLRYSAHDVFQLSAAYTHLQDEMDNPLVQSETQCAVLYDILKHRGMYIDFGLTNEFYRELQDKRLTLLNSIKKCGLVNPNSSMQVARVLAKAGVKLTEKTESGRPSTRKAVLEGIRKPKQARKICGDILQYRSYTKDIGTAKNLARNSDGNKVYPTLWRLGAVTGRSTCDTPNLQQMNKHEGDPRVRGIVLADPNNVIGSVDFDGIEVVTCAYLTKDKRLLKKLIAGADVHGELASEVYGKKYTAKQRYYAKRCVFAMLFGAGNDTMARTVNIDIEHAAAIRSVWNELYPKSARVMEEWQDEANLTGITELPNGWTPSVGMRNGRIAGYRAKNYRIQGIAAFVVRQAAVQLARVDLWKYVRMVVHDEFVNSLPESSAEDILEQIRRNAEVQTKIIRFKCSSELYGRHWGEYTGD